MAQGLAVIVLGAVALSSFSAHKLSGFEKEVAAMSARRTAAEVELEAAKAASAKVRKNELLDREIRQVEARISSVQQAFDRLQRGDIGNTNGYSEYFRAFAQQVIDGLWLTGVTINGAGSDIALRGAAVHADLLPVFIGKLRNEPAMQGKSFSSLEMTMPQAEKASNKTPSGQNSPDALPPHIEFSLQSLAAKPSPYPSGGPVR
jgi:hypothetical protein